jgi:hypothetical protein
MDWLAMRAAQFDRQECESKRERKFYAEAPNTMFPDLMLGEVPPATTLEDLPELPDEEVLF